MTSCFPAKLSPENVEEEDSLFNRIDFEKACPDLWVRCSCTTLYRPFDPLLTDGLQSIGPTPVPVM